MHTQITVNGKEYRGVDDMPPDVRRQYERAMSVLADKDGNGVPDILEAGASFASRTFDDDGNALLTTEVTKSDVVVNGRHYARLEDAPADLRDLIRGATAGSDPGGGITIRLTWPLLFSVLTVALIALAVWWFVGR